MALPQSIVKKTESAFDDIADLWRRRKVLCIFVIFVLVGPSLLSAFMIPHLKSKLEKAEGAKDKAEIQLAPFLAVANQRFPDTTPDKRLELLLKRLDQAIISIQDVARKVSPERSLAPEIQSSLVTNLKTIPSLDVDITCVLSDSESFELASQIKTVFEKAGWKVNGVNQAVSSPPIKHLRLTFGKKPSSELQRALVDLFDGLGYPREAKLDEKLGGNVLKIIVGSK